MHVSHEDYIAQLRLEVVSLARSLQASSSDFLYSVRRLSALRHEVCSDSFDADFSIFVVIDSSTDHLPSAQARSHCSVDWLKVSDEELNEVEFFYRPQVASACIKLIARFGD